MMVGRAGAAEATAGGEIQAHGEAAQEARGVEVARTRGVEHARRRHGVDHVDLLAAHHDRALGPAGQRREVDVAADLLQRLIEVGRLRRGW